MKRPLLITYQLLVGLSDTSTGLLLIVAPSLTLHMMKLPVLANTPPFLSFIGAFVLSVGLACFYGALLATRPVSTPKLETVWLLTAITRASVALVLCAKIFTGDLASGWATVAISDGAIALLQLIGLSRGWLTHAAD